MKKSKKEELMWIPFGKLSFLRRNPQFLTPSQMQALKKSIERDGFLSPILVRPMKGGRFEIVSGNHRALAAQELGMKEIPAIVSTMDDQKSRRIAINLNTIHGEPPAELIAPFLSELDDANLGLVHLGDALLLDVVKFDVHLEARLNELQPADQLNNESVNTPLPSCVCPTCGKKHAKPTNEV